MGIKEITSFIIRNIKSLLIVFSVILGGVLGIILRYSRNEPWSKRDVMYVGYIGELYLRSLRGLIIPLVFSSIISSIGNIDISMSTKIAYRAILFYISTTIMAVILGIVLVTIIHPGGNVSNYDTDAGSGKPIFTADILMDIPRNLFQPNLVQATFETYRTEITHPDKTQLRTQRLLEKHNLTKEQQLPLYEWDIDYQYIPAANIMGLLAFSAALGIALKKIGEKGKPLLNVFHSLADASMVLTGWLIWISPLGISLLIASLIIDVDDFSEMLGQVGMYFLTVVVGIAIHGLLILPSIYFIVIRKLPHKFMLNMGQALITAFATSTSSGTLPVTIDCLENLNHIDPRITRFVLPIGATINMDGTALYEAVAAIFIAQRNNMVLSFGQILAISITSTMVSIGAPGIPSAGAVTTMMVLEVVGLPVEEIGLIISIDWLLDRFRTVMNVLGDGFGSAIVYELSKNDLQKLDEECPGKFDEVKLSQMKIALLEKSRY